MSDEPAGDQAIGDPSFDRYARMVRRVLGVPVALVSVVEPTRQVFPGASGLPEPVATERQTPLSHSFCQYVVKDQGALVVADAREDERLRDNLAIEELDVIAYAGWPLTDHHDRIIGSLCAIDNRPRVWTHAELESLADLAAACSAELAQRGLRVDAALQAERARVTAQRDQVLLALSEALATTRTLGDISAAVEGAAQHLMGCAHAGIWVRSTSYATRIAGLGAGPSGAASEPLSFVGHESTDWEQAARHASLPVDRSNPLGEALLDHSPLHFRGQAELSARYPHLAPPRQAGEARAVLPLTIGPESYGALVLVWPDRRELCEQDRATAQALSDYTAQAVLRALILEDRVEVATTLQLAMLTRLPEPDGLELAARYRPAAARDQVGGDWYDAVVMSSGQTSLMIGDVVGHDITAASVMGQLRSMLRAFAWALAEPPSRSVERLDRASLDLDLDTFATLLYARIEPEPTSGGTCERLLRWTNAGHLPPVLLGPDGHAELLDDGGPADCMLGVEPERHRRDQVVSVAPGSTLLMFTDGLVERRGESITDGLERVLCAARRHHGMPVDDLLDAVLDDLVGPHPQDDVAVLAVRLTATSRRD